MRLHPVCLLLASLCACTSMSESSPINADAAVVQRLDPQRAWRVLDADQLVGYVVRFVDPALATRCTYSVRNTLHQELGSIDELGRAWRFVPHQREAQWVCTATVTQGTARLLDAGAGTRLEPVDLDVLRQAGDINAIQ